jgi:hypothetical protein
MSVFGGPEINQDNLFLCLDAGSSKSYPGSGTNVVDLSYNGNDGTLTGTVTSGVMDAPDFNSGDIKSFYFESGQNAINVANTSFGMGGQSPNCSLCAWINVNQNTVYTNNRIGFRDDSDFDFYALVITQSNTSTLECRLRTNAAVPTLTADYNNYINKWTSVVITAGSDGSGFRMYINGVLVSSAGFSGSFGASSNNFLIGSNVIFSPICYIASVMFYKRVLSEAEVKRHYDAYKGRFRI